MLDWLAYFGKFLNPTRRLKEGKKGFHDLKVFFKATINYTSQIMKLKRRQLQQSIS
jgi:hypothetical protein